MSGINVLVMVCYSVSSRSLYTINIGYIRVRGYKGFCPNDRGTRLYHVNTRLVFNEVQYLNGNLIEDELKISKKTINV